MRQILANNFTLMYYYYNININIYVLTTVKMIFVITLDHVECKYCL